MSTGQGLTSVCFANGGEVDLSATGATYKGNSRLHQASPLPANTAPLLRRETGPRPHCQNHSAFRFPFQLHRGTTMSYRRVLPSAWYQHSYPHETRQRTALTWLGSKATKLGDHNRLGVHNVRNFIHHLAATEPPGANRLLSRSLGGGQTGPALPPSLEVSGTRFGPLRGLILNWHGWRGEGITYGTGKSARVYPLPL